MAESARFGQLAVDLGFLKPGELEECLRAYIDARTRGEKVRLGQVIIERGHITPEQVSHILEEQGRRVKGLVPGYEIISKLGEGGMGAVYKARVVSTGSLVALKLLLPELSDDQEFRTRFLDEAHILMSLDHPNIVSGVDFGEAAGTLYLAARFVDGETAEDVVNRAGAMKGERAMQVALGVAKALEYASARGLVHRDVKPDNIMIERPRGTPKLADLGLAKFTGKSSATKIGQTWGTPAYMSPEQARGEVHIDVRSDIYSLGATLYHMATGVAPFSGKSAVEVLTMHLTEDMPDPKEIWPEIPLRCVEVIRAATIKDQTLRYQSPREIEEDLVEALAGRAPKHAHSRLRLQRATLRLPKEHKRAARRARVRRRKAVRAAGPWAAAGAAVLLLGVFLLAMRRGGEELGLEVEGEIVLRYTFTGPAGEEWLSGGVVVFHGRDALRGEGGACEIRAPEGQALFAVGEHTRLAALVWTPGREIAISLRGTSWEASAEIIAEARTWTRIELAPGDFAPAPPAKGEAVGLSLRTASHRALVLDELVIFEAP